MNEAASIHIEIFVAVNVDDTFMRGQQCVEDMDESNSLVSRALVVVDNEMDGSRIEGGVKLGGSSLADWTWDRGRDPALLDPSRHDDGGGS